MPCLGSRKKVSQKTSSEGSTRRSVSIKSHSSVTQIKQEYQELKSKNMEHLDMIAKQKSELEQLKNQLTTTNKAQEIETQHKQTLSELAAKETQLEEIKKEMQALKETLELIQQEDQTAHLLAEKDKLIKEKECELETLQIQFENERAELVKPALAQVTSQLDELKETNKAVMERLGEKENELAELRSQLNRRDRKPKSGVSKDQEQKQRLNRLTMDLEQDRMLMQKLEELNHQLEAQKQKHEAILESHAKAMAEKDKSLEKLKQSHESAIRNLEQSQAQNLNKLQLRYEKDVSLLNQRLNQAESQAKTTVDDEVSKILYEFEQYEHNHSIEVAHLQQSHQEQISVMRQGQQSEIQQLSGENSKILVPKLRKTGGPSSKFKWPAPEASQSVDLSPRDPKEVHIYTSSISNNPKLKQQEEDIVKTLEVQDIKFKVIDVAKSELALQHMRKQNTKSRALPQIFMGGSYKCTYEEFVQAKNNGKLLQLLSKQEGAAKLSINPNRTSSYLPTPISTLSS
ncbi:hypothetical protein G6F57_003915 [Rhizopus arrhizus]|uniref:Glutaredoxin domain-containing protein n=1 Tax=Rhizopus oryzae TaxID=64495 RepID=A0A9P6XGK1_RHIOR|nr:hypothetical protein G6F23_004881 [Rhizopus arrhizus]KAG0768948.1 hypothetical protein G6F24_001486 [Rhizopus arrhizus]KAG0796973.1 hypothetical protein G6F21_000893 [Rhizopus arrhizus]KAG0814391.1 hypothetical protein G6F20_004813 [Rhizopus arrhizus]KAG0834736.1 hypothetical protein G6F19_005054 [Rhizopus arrhizus]